MTGDVRQTGDWLVTLAGRVTGLGDTNGDTGHQWDDQTGDTNGMGHLCWDINGHIISLAGGREEWTFNTIHGIKRPKTSLIFFVLIACFLC